MDIEKQSRPKGELQKLSERDINKIESEQVVSDPKYIIKELIENSLDANSTSITINLSSRNKYNKEIKEIQIRDNGDGISKEDFPKLCKRRFTTKTKSLNSFGYRGEALSFISQNCKLEVKSAKSGSSLGYCSQFLEGRMVEFENSGKFYKKVPMNKGTVISLTEIFFDNPVLRARLDIQKDSENVLELVWAFSLCHSNIIFKLFKDDMCIFTNKMMIKTENYEDYVVNLVEERLGYRMTHEDFGYKRITYSDGKDLYFNILFSRSNIPIKKKKIVLFYNGRKFKNKDLETHINIAYYRAANSINDVSRSYFFLGMFYDSSNELDKAIEIDTCSKKESIFIENISGIGALLGANLQNFIKELAGYRIYEDSSVNKQRSRRATAGNGKSQQQYDKHRHDPDSTLLTQYYSKTPEVSSHKVRSEREGDLCRSQVLTQFEDKEIQREESSDGRMEEEEVDEDRIVKMDNPLYTKHGEEYYKQLELNVSDRLNSFLKECSLVGILEALQMVVQYRSKLYVIKCEKLLPKWIKHDWLTKVTFSFKEKNRKTWDKEKFLELITKNFVSIGLLEEHKINNMITRFMQIESKGPNSENFGMKISIDSIELEPYEEFFNDLSLRRRSIVNNINKASVKEEFYNSIFFWAFCFKLIDSPAKKTLLDSLKILADFFCYFLLNYLKGKEPGDESWTNLEGFYQNILTDVKEGKTFIKGDISDALHSLVDLKKTYETFERCH